MKRVIVMVLAVFALATVIRRSAEQGQDTEAARTARRGGHQ